MCDLNLTLLTIISTMNQLLSLQTVFSYSEEITDQIPNPHEHRSIELNQLLHQHISVRQKEQERSTDV